jgi:hypothetical protein
VRVPKFPQLGFLQLWGPITLRVDLELKWVLKQSFSPCQDLSNDMLQPTCTQGNQVDSQLLMVGSQIANLTPDSYFGHNLCFRCPNGWCEPILNIYVSISFQWYKELVNPLGFDPCNCSLNIWESTGTQIPKVEIPLGMWGSIPSHSFALPGTCNMILGLPFWPATLQPFALVTSPRLGLWQNSL